MKAEDLFPLVKRLLWIAYVWNDHNFDVGDVVRLAKSDAEKMGIKNLDDANALLTRIAPPTL